MLLSYNSVLQGRHWIVKPIDSLEGFENLRQYGISLALLEHGQVTKLAAHLAENLHGSMHFDSEHCACISAKSADCAARQD